MKTKPLDIYYNDSEGPDRPAFIGVWIHSEKPEENVCIVLELNDKLIEWYERNKK